MTQKEYILNLLEIYKNILYNVNTAKDFFENSTYMGVRSGWLRGNQWTDNANFMTQDDTAFIINAESIDVLDSYDITTLRAGTLASEEGETLDKDEFKNAHKNWFLIKMFDVSYSAGTKIYTRSSDYTPISIAYYDNSSGWSIWDVYNRYLQFTQGTQNRLIPLCTCFTGSTVNNIEEEMLMPTNNNIFAPDKYMNMLWGLYTKETLPEEYTKPFYIKNNTGDTYSCFHLIKKDDLKSMCELWELPVYYKSLMDVINGNGIIPEGGGPEPEPPYVPEDVEGITTQTGQAQNQQNNTGGTGDKISETVNSKPKNPIGTVGTSGTVYVLNWKQLTKVQGEIWKPDVWQSIISLNYKPGDTIQGGSIWPFNLPDYVTALSTTNNKVILGTYEIDFDETNYGVVRKLNPVSDVKIELVENYQIDGIYGGFLDYEPYTKMTFWIPYIGFKQISPHHVYGKNINIYYNIDFSTGQAKCIFEVDSNPLYEWTCSMGAEITFNSSNFGQIKQNAVLGTIGAAVSIGAGIASGGATIGAVGKGAGDMVSTVGNTLGAMTFQSMGSTGSSLERYDPQGCYLIIECVESAAPDGYNHTKGRPSLITTQLKNLKGYTEIADSHFEIPEATESEKSEIENIFKEGVIIR